MDITHTKDLGTKLTERAMVMFPEKIGYNDTVRPLLKQLSKNNMKTHLEKFSSFYTRYYKSSYGAESSAWLLGQVNKTIQDSGASQYGASVRAFPHPWGQSSVIATIPGRSDKRVVIGAHQDSINLFLPALLPAPGADDDGMRFSCRTLGPLVADAVIGSGTVTILEALRVLLLSDHIVQGNASNTIEFHWYSAEEGKCSVSQCMIMDD